MYEHKPSIKAVKEAIDRLRRLHESHEVQVEDLVDIGIVIEAAEHAAGIAKFRSHATINLTFAQLVALRDGLSILAEQSDILNQQKITSLRQARKKVIAAMQQERWAR